ncbi:MAG: PEP-CTERM sorting domain-containing protein [Akkermansiaceae bacterium]|nr:PEP-CTERM sorting domain-containing protein [Akkermansiaceae bacterium]
MMKSINTVFPLAAIAVAAVTGSASAAITYVGGQSNFEAHTNDPTVGWRNATTAKPLDGDGDNVLGTDGYDLSGNSAPLLLPSYVLSSVVSGNHNQTRGNVDDPADPTGADIAGGWSGGSSASGTFGTFVFQGSTMATETLRLGVLYDSDWNLAWGTQTFTLTQTVGGSDAATTPTLTLAGDGVDVAFFDITGIQDGDTFVLSYTDVAINWAHIGGVTFDTVTVPEPTTTALLGLGGLALILRRRK